MTYGVVGCANVPIMVALIDVSTSKNRNISRHIGQGSIYIGLVHWQDVHSKMYVRTLSIFGVVGCASVSIMVALIDISASKIRNISRHIGQEKYIHCASTWAVHAIDVVGQNG